MTITLIILALTVVMFVWGRVRSDIVALAALTLLTAFGILTPTEGLAGFSSSIVVMMVGLFVVGGAVLQTGLARTVGNRLLHLAHGNETLTFVLVMLTTAAIGAFVSNTGTVALLMPIVISMAAQSGLQASRLLMPLAFAGSLGGMLTLIGTPPNLVIDEVLTEAGYGSLGFFSFLPIGIICITIGILVLLPLSRMFLTKSQDKGKKKAEKTLNDLVNEYQLQDNLCKFRIDAQSPIIGKPLRDLGLMSKYGVSILEIRNEHRLPIGLIHDVSQSMAWSDTVLQAGDILYTAGPHDATRQMGRDYRLTELEPDGLNFYDLGLAEIVLMPGTTFEGVRIKDSRMRERFNVNILGVRRERTHLTQQLSECKLHNGDVLLVQGRWDNIIQLNGDNKNWIVLGQPESTAGRVLLDYKAPTAAFIMLLMVLTMALDAIPIPAVTAVMAAALLMVLTGCFRSVEDAYRTINWESIILIGAMMPMSTALEKTGASALMSQTLVSVLGDLGPTVLLAGIYVTTSLMSFFISNTATAVLMAPIALVAAQQTGVNPMAFMFAVTLGASMCFASPFSTPPNALVMRAGGYKFMDYVKVGLPLQITIGIVMTFVLPLLFPY